MSPLETGPGSLQLLEMQRTVWPPKYATGTRSEHYAEIIYKQKQRILCFSKSFCETLGISNVVSRSGGKVNYRVGKDVVLKIKNSEHLFFENTERRYSR